MYGERWTWYEALKGDLRTVRSAASFWGVSALEVMGHRDRRALVEIAQVAGFVESLAAGIKWEGDALTWPEWWEPV